MRFILLLCLTVLSGSAMSQSSPLQLRAWRGDSVAMMDISQAFTFGDGLPVNADSAKFYIAKAAKMGYPDAQYLYGSGMMAQVTDTKKYTEGFKWVQKAADQGLESAQVKLSAVHRSKGTFTPADQYYDLKKAYAYAEKAALQGNLACLRSCAESRLTGTGTVRNDSLAIAFMKTAADKQDAVATVRMGDFYLDGKMTGKPEPFTALGQYQKAHALPNLNMEQRNLAEFGMFRVDSFIRQVHNAMIAAGGIVPAGAFEYLIRKE